jgi:hypothetical protein
VLCGVGAFLGAAQFFQSLMFAFFFWMTLTIGASIVLMIQHLTGGVWGLLLRRMLEAAIMTLPLLGLVFLVLAVGAWLNLIYPWTRPEVIAESEIIQEKTAVYLTLPFWTVRGVLYFAAWILIGTLLNRWSAQQDQNGDPKIAERMRTLSGPGIPIFVLLWTLAATDWGMSLEPEWFSSMYPVTFIIEGLMVTMAWGVLALSVMRSRKLLPFTVPVNRLHDLGIFMFAFVVVWTYINFSQYLIIWSGNLAEETPWYYHRLNGGWQVLGVGLMLGHFFLPFFALLSRHPKRNFTTMTAIACFLIFIQAVFVFWSVTPSFYPDGFHLSLLDPLALVGVGGLWLAMWARNLKQRPLLPVNDHRLPELEQQAAAELSHGHGHTGEAHTAH